MASVAQLTSMSQAHSHTVSFSSRKKLLGLDVGTKVIGAALTDTDQRVAFPYTVVKWLGNEDVLLSWIRTLLQEESVEKVIMGLPHEKGQYSGMSNERVRALAHHLAARITADTGLLVDFVDEHVSTLEARNRLDDLGSDVDSLGHGRTDDVAAQILLERYLHQQSV